MADKASSRRTAGRQSPPRISPDVSNPPSESFPVTTPSGPDSSQPEDQVASRTHTLQQSEERLRAIVDSVADAIVTIDESGLVCTFNRSAERMFRYAAQEIIGQNINVLFGSSSRDDADLLGFLQTGLSSNHGASREVIGLHKDGTTLVIELALGELSESKESNVKAEGGNLSAGPPPVRKSLDAPPVGSARISTVLMRDISERKDLQRQVLEVAAHEQRRIGQDLHDSTQQELCGLGMIAQNLFELLESQGAATHAEIAERLSQGIGHALENVRRISRGLVPAEIGAHGLRKALAELASQTSDLGGMPCRFECDDIERIRDPSVATHLFRIAQEAITNVVKHANARNIHITLSTQKGLVILRVADDGDGMSAQDTGGATGMGIGLKVMAYRAGMFGGSLRVQPVESGGTEVVCTVPLA